MTQPDAPRDLERLAQTLEETGDYRVLRRIDPRQHLAPWDDSPKRLGLFVDTETTGLDADKDEIIEIGMVPFTYGINGCIYEIHEPFSRLRQPGQPITEEITRVTGITNDMLEGQRIDAQEVANFLEPVALVVAHNARFDRRFLERFCPAFAGKPWACSVVEIPWAEEGFGNAKLGQIANALGYFFDGHRAVEDCLAAITLLSMDLPLSGEKTLSRLLENARQTSCYIQAVNAPFECKDSLKARGYEWNPGNPSKGEQKCWWREVPEVDLEDEMTWLEGSIYNRPIAKLPVKPITAMDRYSERAHKDPVPWESLRQQQLALPTP